MLPFFLAQGAVAKRLCTGLQIRVGRFDSGPRLQLNQGLRSFRTKSFFLCRSVVATMKPSLVRYVLKFNSLLLIDF